MLQRSGATVVAERPARKEPLDDEAARELLGKAGTLLVARGRKVEKNAGKDARLDHLRGPSGNFRAPMLLRGRTLRVGFNAEALQELVGG